MGGKTVLLPTVINGKIVSPDDAVQHYRQTGEHMGIFRDQQSADAYDKNMHESNGWTGPNNSWPNSKPASKRLLKPRTEKVLTDVEAKNYLKKARGDRSKARQLAVADGWTIPE
jgi:hypothetical protein